MGMGAYDEDEQRRKEEMKSQEDEDEEVLTLSDSRNRGEVVSESPDSVSEMMDEWSDDD